MRHFGFLSTTGKRKHLKGLQKELGKAKVYKIRSEIQHLLCPRCKKGKLETVCIFSGKDPPKRWLKRLESQNRMYKNEILSLSRFFGSGNGNPLPNV